MTTRPQSLINSQNEVSEAIWELFQESYAIEAKLIGAKDFPPLQRTVREIQASDNSFIGIANNHIVHALLEYTVMFTAIEIHSLVVAPSHFRKGLAGYLLRELAELHRGKTQIVETSLHNLPAINLYQKHGFKKAESFINPAGFKIVGFRRD